MHLTDLIFDRTQEDLINDTDKAYIDYADLNRVENACAYLAGVFGIPISTKQWTMEDYRTETEMKRLRNNIHQLRSFYNEAHYPSLGTTINYTSIKEANDIERLLHDIEVTYETVIHSTQKLAFKLGTRPLGNRG